MAAATGLEPVTSRLQDGRSGLILSYTAEKLLVDRERFELSQKVCRTFMLPVTSPAQRFNCMSYKSGHTIIASCDASLTREASAPGTVVDASLIGMAVGGIEPPAFRL